MSKRITPLRQPEGSSLCGQTCVAMVAGVSLRRAIEAVGHERKRGTTTRDLVKGLQTLGVRCATRLRRVSRRKPCLPKYGIIAMHRPQGNRRPTKWHWMVIWEGDIYDPEGGWPEIYADWRMTSFLEIHFRLTHQHQRRGLSQNTKEEICTATMFRQ